MSLWRWIWLVVVCALACGEAAPGSVGSTATPVPIEITFAGTPEGAGPVSFAASNVGVATALTKGATTGLTLGAITAANFESSSSYLACMTA